MRSVLFPVFAALVSFLMFVQPASAQFLLAENECFLVAKGASYKKTPKFDVPVKHGPGWPGLAFRSFGADKEYYLMGILTKSNGNKVTAKSKDFKCHDAKALRRMIMFTRPTIKGRSRGGWIKGTGQNAFAAQKYFGEKHRYSLARLCYLKPALDIGDAICLRAARAFWAEQPFTKFDRAQAEVMIERSCLLGESPHACAIEFLRVKNPKTIVGKQRMLVAKTRWKEFCRTRRDCGLPVYHKNIEQVLAGTYGRDKAKLETEILRRGFKTILFYGDKFSRECTTIDTCKAYAKKLFSQDTMSNYDIRTAMSALVAACDVGKGSGWACFRISAEIQFRLDSMETGKKDADYVRDFIGFVPTRTDQLIYARYACDGGGDLKNIDLRGCEILAPLYEKGLPGHFSSHYKRARGMYSFVCLFGARDKSHKSCRKACAMGVKPHCLKK